MFLIRIIYILISLSFMYSQTYFDRIFGGDVQFGDARSMALANTYTTTGSTSSITARNPARLSYLANGNRGILTYVDHGSGPLHEGKIRYYNDVFTSV